MAITVAELAARLNAEAARRRTTGEALLDELAAELDGDPLEAFIGCGASGRSERSIPTAFLAASSASRVRRQ